MLNSSVYSLRLREKSDSSYEKRKVNADTYPDLPRSTEYTTTSKKQFWIARACHVHVEPRFRNSRMFIDHLTVVSFGDLAFEWQRRSPWPFFDKDLTVFLV